LANSGSSYPEHLEPYLETLKRAVSQLKDGSDSEHYEGMKTVLRISRSLESSAGNYGFPDLAEAAMQIEQAFDHEIIERVENLIALMEKLSTKGIDKQKVILIVGKDGKTTKSIRSNLSTASKVMIAASAFQIEEIFSKYEISLILLDLVMEKADVRSLTIKMFKRAAAADIPVIALFAKGSAMTKTECFAYGVVDYFEKPYDIELLNATVSARIHLTSEYKHVAPQKRHVTIGLTGIDNFKSIVRNQGETFIDNINRRIASIFTECFRESDHYEKCSTSSFIIIFPDTHLEGAVTALQKVQSALKKESFATNEGKSLKVTFTAGIAELTEDTTVKDVVVKASQLLRHSISVGHVGFIAAKSITASSLGRVIIAEDDDLTASVVRHRLELDGYKVEHFRDGASALKASKHGKIALFILDTKIPVMNGFELIEDIRKEKKFTNVPIVMLSPPGREGDVVRAFDLGADEYITKPFSPVELKARIDRLMMRDR